MHKYAKICSDPISISPMHSYAFIWIKYAKIHARNVSKKVICNTCKKYALPDLRKWAKGCSIFVRAV